MSSVACSVFVSFFHKCTHCDGAVFAHSSSDACSGGSVSERQGKKKKILTLKEQFYC